MKNLKSLKRTDASNTEICAVLLQQDKKMVGGFWYSGLVKS